MLGQYIDGLRDRLSRNSLLMLMGGGILSANDFLIRFSFCDMVFMDSLSGLFGLEFHLKDKTTLSTTTGLPKALVALFDFT